MTLFDYLKGEIDLVLTKHTKRHKTFSKTQFIKCQTVYKSFYVKINEVKQSYLQSSRRRSFVLRPEEDKKTPPTVFSRRSKRYPMKLPVAALPYTIYMLCHPSF